MPLSLSLSKSCSWVPAFAGMTIETAIRLLRRTSGREARVALDDLLQQARRLAGLPERDAVADAVDEGAAVRRRRAGQRARDADEFGGEFGAGHVHRRIAMAAIIGEAE